MNTYIESYFFEFSIIVFTREEDETPYFITAPKLLLSTKYRFSGIKLQTSVMIENRIGDRE